MAGFFGGDDPDEVDNPSNPGNNPNTDAGDLHAESEAEAQARDDYDQQVGSDEHEGAVSDARDESGFDDPRSDED